eukprot:CAMPEP_0206394392 /NCGR_PEP_ID=MMETSP0294-20121207/21351_1 /ASSEMBLY_ACC=CAM_ASM_000327 /TAXON_ID=39354 /ORGANISM="Heterosigma akashiwo, Strain CCMP2393" /LENGTH=195 /DNA_ID=CAMNT_0053848301 /DNA_START=405 /DNA_END=987 /DNA_ORIENTATION=-
MLAMEDRKMAVRSHGNSAVSSVVENTCKGFARNSSWASRSDAGSVGIIDISHTNAPDHDEKGGKGKAVLSVGWSGGMQGSSRRRVSSSTAKVSQGELQEVETAVRRKSSRTGGNTGSRGVHSSMTTGRVARGKTGQRGPGCHQALRSTGGGSRGECSLHGGRPLQDSHSGRGAQAKGAALAPRGAPGASAQGEQG